MKFLYYIFFFNFALPIHNTICPYYSELWERIVATFGAIRNRPGELEHVRESMMQRLNGFVVGNGQHFEHLM